MGHDSINDDLLRSSHRWNVIDRKNDVKLRQRYFIVRESKTAAGRNRAVPISKKTLPYFEFWMQQPGKYIITDDYGNQLSYHQYRARLML